MADVQDHANATRSGLGIESILDSLELNQQHQNLSSESLDKPIEQTVAEKWWDDYINSGGVGRLAMTRKKLALLPFVQQEDYFPEAVFELETKLSAAQYVEFLVEIEQQQPELFVENLSWFASSMIFFCLNNGQSEQLEHVVTVMAEKQQTTVKNIV